MRKNQLLQLEAKHRFQALKVTEDDIEAMIYNLTTKIKEVTTKIKKGS